MTAEIDWEIQKQSDRESDWSVDRSSNPVLFSTGIKDQSIGSEVRRSQQERLPHDFDDDGVCTRCGFDGAEYIHWKKYTAEGRSSGAEAPSCVPG